MPSYFKRHRLLTLGLSELFLVVAFAFIFSSFQHGQAFADCVVQEGQNPATAGCVNSAASINAIAAQCMADAQAYGPGIALGWDFFVPSSLTIVNGAVTPIELGNINCDNSVPIGTDDLFYTADSISGQSNTNNIVEFPNYYPCGPNYSPCTPAYGPEPLTSTATNAWTYQETTVYVNGSEVPGSNYYVIALTGYGTPCGPDGPVSPTCGGYTNIDTTDLGLNITLVNTPPPPPASVTCGTFSSTSSGTTYSLVAPVTIKNYTPTEPPDTMTISGVPDTGPLTYNYDAATGTLTVSATANPPPGSYTVTYTFTGDGGSLHADCTGLLQTYDKPYLKIYGGDIVVGSGFASDSGLYAGGATASCQSNSNADIYAWNQGSPSYNGASTSDGIFAVGLVEGLASANAVRASGSSVASPESLTFANNDPATAPYGGDFGTAPCAGIGSGSSAQSYYSALQASPYVATSPPATISSYPSTNSCRNVYTYSDANVTISNNVSLSSNHTCPTSWSSTSSTPLFYVVVDGGDIYIDNSVTRLDGVYIAEPNSSGQGGNIYTCGNSVTSQQNDLFNSDATGCSKQLIVNGSFIAKNVDLQRTNGNVANAPTSSGTDSCSDGTAVDDTVDSNAAEVFCYSPLDWLANPLPSQTTSSSNSFQSITSLPPLL